MAKASRKIKQVRNSKAPSIRPSDIVDQYIHDYEKRPYNPPVGLVIPETDKEMPRTRYEYDPHLDPQLQWAGKKEHTSFEVDMVSLHVHERIDPLTIIEKALKKPKIVQQTLFHYFEQPENNPPIREAIDSYKHSQNWTNRLIAGDSLLVMNSLLQKEGMAGKVQMVYIDPPYGIRYGSNFQPFVNKHDVKDGKDEDLSQEPEMIKAFRDTWELGIHSYLIYLRDRLLLSRELLSDRGSIFVQINDYNLHHVREIMDEIFGSKNFIAVISFRKTAGFSSTLLPSLNDFIIWYAKDKEKTKYHQLFLSKSEGIDKAQQYKYVESPDGERRKLTKDELNNESLLPKGSKIYRITSLTSQGYSANTSVSFELKGKKYLPPGNRHWTCSIEGLKRLAQMNRIEITADTIGFVRYVDDYPVFELSNMWNDTGTGSFTEPKIYVVQTATKVVERCILMTTDPGDLVFDPTCGSGTTAYIAEKWGRKWITCDTSRVALTLAKQRIMTAVYDYYELANVEEGVASGFIYEIVPHITIKNLANNEPPIQEVLYDKPRLIKSKTRVAGAFISEAVSAPAIRSLDDAGEISVVDDSIARTGETTRQEQWRNELLATGILGTGTERIAFSRVEPLAGTEWLHADAETKEREPRRVVISFGTDYAPLEQTQVARAIEEALSLVPQPKIVVFAAFQFDPEAAKDIDELKWAGVTVLRVQMNTDLLTEDLKKKVSKSQSFWLMGQPDIELTKANDGKYAVEVHGFDYYNTKTHEIESGDASRIAMWMLDTDYDGRSLYPQQVFFPIADDSDGWTRIGRSIKAHIEETLLENYHGTVSLPFEPGPNKRIAVKIIDDRGIESLRILKAK